MQTIIYEAMVIWMLVFIENFSDYIAMRTLITLFLVFATAIVLYFQGSTPIEADNLVAPIARTSTQPATSAQNNVVFDISVHTAEQLRDVLKRAEELASGPRSAAQPANISIMLHGKEIEYFTIDHYKQYQDIVDLSAKLDAYNVIQFKMCETAMKDFGIKKDNIPSFIEFVPDGELEINKLARQGYTIM